MSVTTPDSPMTDERLAKIRAREQAATKAPWFAVDGNVGGPESATILACCDSVYGPPLADFNARWIAEDWVDDNERGKNWNDAVAADVVFCARARQDIPDLLAEVERLRTELKRYEWRPISEIHEDYGLCVLMDIYDPADLVIGSNLDNDFEIERWTHFAEVPKLTTEKARLLLLAEELAIPERAL